MQSPADPPPKNGKLEIVENGQFFEAVDFEKAIELAGNFIQFWKWQLTVLPKLYN